MSARYRTPFPPILGQQISGILERLDELERQRPAGAGGIGAAGGGGGGGGGGVGGTGTVNAIPKWTASAFLGDSRFIDDGVATELSYGDNKFSRLFVTAYGFSGGIQYVSEVICRAARGVQGAFTPVLASDILGVYAFRGCDSNNNFPVADNAKIMATAADNWSTTSRPTNIGFWTTDWNQTTERLRFAINAQGRVVLYQPNSPYTRSISLVVPTGISQSQFYTLPTAYPAASGYVLSCTVDGYMSWVAQAGGGVGGSGTAGYLSIWTGTTTLGNSPVLYQSSYDLTSINSKAYVASDLTVQGILYPYTDNYTDLGSASIRWRNLNCIKINGSTWPSGYGTSGQVLTTNGAGTLSWTSAGGGVGGSGTTTYLPIWTGSTTLGNSPIFYQSYYNSTTIDSKAYVASDLTVHGTLYPYVDNAYDIGSSSIRWANLWVYNINGAPLGSVVSGSGTDKYIPIWTGTSTIGNSVIHYVLGYPNQLLFGADVCPDGSYIRLGGSGRHYYETWTKQIACFDPGYILCWAHYWPHSHNTYDLGASDNKWRVIYAVSTSFGDLGFEEKACPKCGRPFRKGEKLALTVKGIKKGETVTVPCHLDCEGRSR